MQPALPPPCAPQDRWLGLYGQRFGLSQEKAGRAQRELQQQLAQRVSEQLFSEIDWDVV